jgi:hypothetical protein
MQMLWQLRAAQSQERPSADRLWVAQQLLRPLSLAAQAQDLQERQQAFQSVGMLPQRQRQRLQQLRQRQPQQQTLRVVQLVLFLIKAQLQLLQCLESAQLVRF